MKAYLLPRDPEKTYRSAARFRKNSKYIYIYIYTHTRPAGILLQTSRGGREGGKEKKKAF